MKTLTPFHVAVPVHDLELCLAFYQSRFDVQVGRRSEQWIDLNLYGHQFVLHLDQTAAKKIQTHNAVDGKSVPVPHLGVILDMVRWRELADKLRSLNQLFVIEPYIRFEGAVGEQATMFLLDPSGNALEFKAFADFDQIFAH